MMEKKEEEGLVSSASRASCFPLEKKSKVSVPHTASRGCCFPLGRDSCKNKPQVLLMFFCSEIPKSGNVLCWLLLPSNWTYLKAGVHKIVKVG